MKVSDTFYAVKFGDQFMESHKDALICAIPKEHKLYHAMYIRSCPCFEESKAIWGHCVCWTTNLNRAQLFHDRRQAVKIINMKNRGSIEGVSSDDDFVIIKINVTRQVEEENYIEKCFNCIEEDNFWKQKGVSYGQA